MITGALETSVVAAAAAAVAIPALTNPSISTSQIGKNNTIGNSAGFAACSRSSTSRIAATQATDDLLRTWVLLEKPQEFQQKINNGVAGNRDAGLRQMSHWIGVRISLTGNRLLRPRRRSYRTRTRAGAAYAQVAVGAG